MESNKIKDAKEHRLQDRHEIGKESAFSSSDESEVAQFYVGATKK